MGVICQDGRAHIKNILEEIDPLKFYDVIVPIHSIKDIIKGWHIKITENLKKDYKNKINDKLLKIGIIGNSNKGKSFILSKLSDFDLPSGTSIKTEGLSIKYPNPLIFNNKKIALLDSAGLETPVLKSNKEVNNGSDLFKEKSKEKVLVELFLQNYIIHNSDILIVVLGILTYSEQKILNRIKIELKRAKLNKTLYVIHNLLTYTTINQVKNYINDTLLNSATFNLEEKIKFEGNKGICFFEKNSNPQIFHLIFANEYSDAGKYYNEYTLSFVKTSFDKITNYQGFDVIETIKKRFEEVSKEFIENLKEKIEFDPNSRDTIKLIKPKEIILKRCYIDELGFSNLRANGFEPNYNYYKKDNQIIVKVETPGNCNIESSIEYNGEYTIIKLSGNKEKDEEPVKIEDNIFNCRELGQFSLEIPLNIKDTKFKNEDPKIENKKGVFILAYELEKKKEPVTFQPKDLI